MSKIHLWVGVTSKTSSDIDKYFDPSMVYSEEKDSSSKSGDYTNCNFAQDIKSDGYNEDFLSVFHRGKDEDLRSLLDEPLSETDDDLIDACEELRITKGNMAIAYTDSRLEFSSGSKLFFGELVYIGCFEWLGP